MNIVKKSYDILKSEKEIMIVVNVTSCHIKIGSFFKYRSHLLLKIDDTHAIQYENVPDIVWEKIKENKVYFIEFGPLGVVCETLIHIQEER